MGTVNNLPVRLMWLAVASFAGFCAWRLIRAESIYGFALLTAAVTTLVGVSLEWRRINLERVLFFHGPRGAICAVSIVLFTAASVVLRAAAVGLAAIFTFPATNKLANSGSEAIDRYAVVSSADLGWTLICIAATAGFGFVALLIAD